VNSTFRLITLGTLLLHFVTVATASEVTSAKPPESVKENIRGSLRDFGRLPKDVMTELLPRLGARDRMSLESAFAKPKLKSKVEISEEHKKEMKLLKGAVDKAIAINYNVLIQRLMDFIRLWPHPFPTGGPQKGQPPLQQLIQLVSGEEQVKLRALMSKLYYDSFYKKEGISAEEKQKIQVEFNKILYQGLYRKIVNALIQKSPKHLKISYISPLGPLLDIYFYRELPRKNQPGVLLLVGLNPEALSLVFSNYAGSTTLKEVVLSMAGFPEADRLKSEDLLRVSKFLERSPSVPKARESFFTD